MIELHASLRPVRSILDLLLLANLAHWLILEPLLCFLVLMQSNNEPPLLCRIINCLCSYRGRWQVVAGACWNVLNDVLTLFCLLEIEVLLQVLGVLCHA